MQTTLKGAVDKITGVLEGIPEFADSTYMTIGPDTARPPVLIYDITDVATLADNQNRGDFIQQLSVSIQVWAVGAEAALALTDKLHSALRQAKMVEARDNVFTLSEEFTPNDPGLPSGLLRVVSQYRLLV